MGDASRRRHAGRWLRASCAVLPALSALTFAGRLHPWLEALSHFQVFYAGAYGLLLALLLLPRGRAAFWRPRRGMLLLLAGFCCHAGQIAWLWLPPRRLDLDKPQVIRAAWANLHLDNDDYEGVRRGLLSLDADLIGLSEVSPAMRRELEALAAVYPHRLEGRADHLLLLSRLPLERRDASEIAAGRHVLAADLVSGRRRARVLIAHAPLPALPEHPQVLASLTEMAAGHSTLLFLADLNVTNWSPLFHDLLATGGLRDGRRGFGMLPSWRWPGFPWSLYSFPIDHVLVKGPLQLRSLERGPDLGSDHDCLLAVVELGGPRGREAQVAE